MAGCDVRCSPVRRTARDAPTWPGRRSCSESQSSRPLHLTVPYACLELLGQRPGLSNAELARGAFVTRQSMNVVLRGLEERGLVIRPETAPRGRELPTVLTETGRVHLQAASAAVRNVEKRMCAGLTPAQQRELLNSLTACVRNLTESHGRGAQRTAS